MLRFANGSAWLWMFAILALVVIFVLRNFQAQRVLKKTFGDKMLPFFLARFSVAKRNWKMGLMLLAALFMVVALARPQMGKGRTQIVSQGVELMMVVDVSRSMLAEDVKPSRLEHAKKEMSRLLDLLGGDKVGLIAFAGSPVLLSPMTTDKSALRMFIDGLSPNTVESQGTEIAKALSEAQNAFTRGGEEVGPNQRMTRVVVLISDGEDHEEGAIKLAQEMAQNGTRVFAMAFGSERGGKIPSRDGRGLLQGYVKDKKGGEVITRVNEDLMRQIARAGGGSFYHVTFGGSQMKGLREDIDKLEKTEFDSLSAENYDERFQIPLFMALMLALLELFIGTRRRSDSAWRGRFIKAGLLVAVSLSGLPMPKAEVSLQETWQTNQALSLLEKKRKLEAFELYSKLAVENPQEPVLLFNLATSFMTVEQLEKAKPMFERLISQETGVGDPILRFSAHYNLAQVYSSKGLMDIDKALHHYQSALKILPDSQEIKTNIELLMQMQGGGGGGGDQNEEQDKQDQSEDEQPKEPQEFSNKPQQPNQFESKDLSKQDVNQILEELKGQEQKIRAKYERKGKREAEREKNW